MLVNLSIMNLEAHHVVMWNDYQMKTNQHEILMEDGN